MQKETRQGAVLVVDNDRHSLIAAQAVLEPLGCRVVLARSGPEAVEKTGSDDFAAIVMDVCMPDLDGYAAGSFIRQNPRSARTPILFVSGEDVDLGQLTRLFGNAGQVDSMRKPLETDILVAKVGAWLETFRKNQQVHELELAMDSARAQARTKDDILAMVAHDLNGPLAAMRTHAEATRRRIRPNIDDPNFVQNFARFIDLVDRSVDRMAKIVNDLLDAARIDAGTLRLDIGRYDLAEAVEQTTELLRPLADKRGVTLSFPRPDRGCVAVCDRDRVLQVLSNLVGNALKFAPSSSTVQIDLTASSSEHVLCVRDAGPGIPADQLPFIFEKYWQGTSPAGRQGVGLGLAIARAIVLAHGGRIWVESQRGEGSRFFVAFPSAALEPAVPSSGSLGVTGSGHRANDGSSLDESGLVIACKGA
jgi:signal transduction histidine kinase